MNNARETRIFYPFTSHSDNPAWSYQILGNVIKPFVLRYKSKIDWFWFCKCFSSRDCDRDNCKIEEVPEKYFCPNGWHKSIKFRFRVKKKKDEAAMEKWLEALIKKHDYMITDIRNFKTIDDLGSNRFAPKRLSRKRKTERALLVNKFFHASSALALDSLKRAGKNRWTTEYCPHKLNYFGNMLDSAHHLFCNITSVKTDIFILKKGKNKSIVGPWDLKNAKRDGWKVKSVKSLKF